MLTLVGPHVNHAVTLEIKVPIKQLLFDQRKAKKTLTELDCRKSLSILPSNQLSGTGEYGSSTTI
jgi:hypothetical protein